MTDLALLNEHMILYPYNNQQRLNPSTTHPNQPRKLFYKHKENINVHLHAAHAPRDLEIECCGGRIQARRTCLESCGSKCLFFGCSCCEILIGIGVVALLVLVGFSILYFGYGLGNGTMLMLERIGLGFQTLLEATGFAIVLGTVVGCCLCIRNCCGK